MRLHEAWFTIAERLSDNADGQQLYICNIAKRLLRYGLITPEVHAEIMERVGVEALAHGFTKEEWEYCRPALWPTTTSGKVARLKFITAELRFLTAREFWRKTRGSLILHAELAAVARASLLGVLADVAELEIGRS